MNIEEKIELALKIADKLVGITPSEWSKWCLYAREKGLYKAIQFAQIMQSSVSLRPGPKQSYRTISDVIPKFKKDLESLSSHDISEVLGYVRWALVARRAIESFY